MNQLPGHEVLPSGKTIIRDFDKDGDLSRETHSYGATDVAISVAFKKGVKEDEFYVVKNRMCSRRNYEKHRVHYPDMPEADQNREDDWQPLLAMARAQQRQNKIEREKRLAESEESKFPRPAGTNWLRVIAKDKAHLVEFASRDWKLLFDERIIRSGRDWLDAFGFGGIPRKPFTDGPGPGYEVIGDVKRMLEISKTLLPEVVEFERNRPLPSVFPNSIRPRRKARPAPPSAWPTVLPPLIEFLSSLTETQIKIFNHHR